MGKQGILLQSLNNILVTLVRIEQHKMKSVLRCQKYGTRIREARVRKISFVGAKFHVRSTVWLETCVRPVAGQGNQRFKPDSSVFKSKMKTEST